MRRTCIKLAAENEWLKAGLLTVEVQLFMSVSGYFESADHIHIHVSYVY